MQQNTLNQNLLQQVKEVEPILRKYAAEAEQNRRLSGPVIQAMKEAGFFRMWKPKKYGGLETDPITGFRVLEELARIDSAVSWNLQITAGIDIILQWFPDRAMDEVFSREEETIVAGTWHPPGQAVAVEGGYRVSGHWNISSGCQYANWFFLNAIVVDGDQMRTYENGQPVLLFLILPASEGKVVESWNAIGMRGTGSHDIVVEDVFVPEHRTIPMAPIESAAGAAFQGPLYRNSVWYAIAALAGPALGIGRAAINDITALVKSKIPNYTQNKLKDNQVVQMKLAEAEATLSAGRAYLFDVLRSTWETAKNGSRISTEQRMQLQLASTYAIQSAARTVRIVHELAGLTAIRESNSIQRHFRDIHVITQHAFTSTDRYQAVGQLMLGLEPNWGFFYF